MKPPIFVYEPDYLVVYTTKERVEAALEAIDVNNGVYTAVYDAEGYLLNLRTTREGDVFIEDMSPSVNKSEDLRELLYPFLKGGKRVVVTEDWLEDATLDELVTKALVYKTK